VAPAQPQYSCANGASGTAWTCSNIAIDALDPASRLETSTGAVPNSVYSDRGYYGRFIAYNVFDSSTRAMFNTSTTATTYDGAALTETGLTDLFSGASFDPVTPPKLNAAVGLSGTSPGFFFGFPMVDERTATNSLLLQNCLSWYTMAPGAPCNADADCGTGATCNATAHECTQALICGSSTAIPARTAFLYQMNATDGSTNCGLTSATGIRYQAPGSSFIVPPPPAQPLISVNAAGGLQYSIIAPAGQFSPPAPGGQGGSSAAYSFYYTIEVPRELHQCRHGNNVNACQ
jgi:type IV pilus assembly protein PilY1